MANVKNLGCTLREGQDKVALIDLFNPQEQREVTYDQLTELADAIASSLIDDGVSRGKRIGIISHNSTEFIVALLGIMRAGAVAINYKFPEETIEFMCNDAMLDLIFCDRQNKNRLPAQSQCISLDPEEFHTFLKSKDFQTISPKPL